ncbi:hypothetical protein [Mycolicibacterium thermoresistibile]
MRTHVRTAAVAGLLLVLTTGCTQVTGGTVAMTTEPGPPLTTTATTTPRAAPDLTLPRLPRRTGTPNPDVPAPPNALTMTCAEYNELDADTQMAVVQAHIAEEDNPFGMLGPEAAKPVADTMCQFMPEATVKQVLLGGG